MTSYKEAVIVEGGPNLGDLLEILKEPRLETASK